VIVAGPNLSKGFTVMRFRLVSRECNHGVEAAIDRHWPKDT
jgi:hypothetical protein